MRHRLLLFAAFLLLGAVANGQIFDSPGAGGFDMELPKEHAQVSAAASHITVTPGQTFHVAVAVTIDDGWVFYSPKPGEIALPASLKVTADDMILGDVLWEADHPYVTDLGDGTSVSNPNLPPKTRRQRYKSFIFWAFLSRA